MSWFFLLTFCLASFLGAESQMQVIRQWTELDFVYPSETARRNAWQNNFYVRGNSIPIDVDVQYRRDGSSRIFVTNPRFDVGRPITLGTLDRQGRLNAYPNYSWHDNQGRNCNGMTSVFRTMIDQCNRIWVMDSGKINEDQVCPPQLLAFDLDTDTLVYKHRPDPSTYLDTSLFITPVVDLRGDCAAPFVYVADVTGFGLLVVDVARDLSWRVNHKLFYPYPSHGTFTIDGESFDLMDGVLGMALSPFNSRTQDRTLYFHALASTTENFVSTKVLRNASFINNPDADPRAISVFRGERPNQSAAEAMDSNGILYFGQMEPPSLWCWNSATEFSQENFYRLAVNTETMQFASGVKIIKNLYGEEELWVLTSSFQRVMTGSISTEEVNFRIHAEKVSVLLKDCPCLNYSKQGSSNNANLPKTVQYILKIF